MLSEADLSERLGAAAEHVAVPEPDFSVIGRRGQRRAFTRAVGTCLAIAIVTTGGVWSVVALSRLEGRSGSSAPSTASSSPAQERVLHWRSPFIGLALGPDGLWIATRDGHLRGVDPATGAVTYRTIIPLDRGSRGLAVGPGGAVWFDVQHGGRGRFDLTSHQETFFPTSLRIATGEGLWGLGDEAFRLDPAGNELAGVPVSGVDIAVGEGAVWVAQGIEGTVARIDPVTYEVTTYRVDAPGTRAPPPVNVVGTSLGQVVAGGGRVWLCCDAASRIVGLKSSMPESQIRIELPPLPAGRYRMAYGDGAMWVVGDASPPLGASQTMTASLTRGVVYRIDPGSGEVTGPVRTLGLPEEIAVGAGRVWVAGETDSGTILTGFSSLHALRPLRSRRSTNWGLGVAGAGIALAAGVIWLLRRHRVRRPPRATREVSGGWRQRYTLALVVLVVATMAALFYPSSPLGNCLDYLGPGHDCLHHHIALRLLIGVTGLVIATAMAFLPKVRSRRLVSRRT